MKDYWALQVPIYREWRTMRDDYAYWSDYQRNTGFTPRYPTRHYNTHAVENLANSVGRVARTAKSIYG